MNKELSNQQVDQITSVLENNLSEKNKKLRKIQNNNYPYNTFNKKKLIKKSCNVEIDKNTGENKIISDNLNSNNNSLSDIIDDTNSIDNKLEDDSKTYLKEIGFEEDDILKFINIINKYNKGEKFDIMKEAPLPFLKIVYKLSPNLNKIEIKNNAKFILEQFISQIKCDKEFINLQNAIKKELDVPEMADMYENYEKELMENKLLKKADVIEEKGYIEKANILRKISKEFTSSYKFDKFLDALKNNTNASKRLDKKIKKYKNIRRSFNYKYYNSKFKIKDVDLIRTTLLRHTNESENDIKKFIILFCNICTNFDSNNVIDHSYMFYTINNILSLDLINQEGTFYKEMINKINYIINMIKEKK